MLAIFYTALLLFGIVLAIHSILNSRTTQAAFAWSISLVSFPMLTIPFYIIFGFKKFRGYKKIQKIQKTKEEFFPSLENSCLADGGKYKLKVVERLSRSAFTGLNEVDLLINGERAFDEIFKHLDNAKNYILVQFYIVRDDKIGKRFQRKLIELRNRGVKVYFLIDEIGSYELPKKYTKELESFGVHVALFSTSVRKSNRFQINFRNHRKVVLIDGHTAFVGGMNLADEYINSFDSKLYWRDTQVKICGEAVKQVEISFLEDWYWATDEMLTFKKMQHHCHGNLDVLVLNSGPADRLESFEMTFVHLINEATERIWIATPYFVPDNQIITSLKLAKLRGVEVKLIIPEKSDNIFVDFASKDFLHECLKFEIDIYQFDQGFMHQKVMLIDQDIATVGTANIDNRSFYLNFETTVVINSKQFNHKIEQMLLLDISLTSKLTIDKFNKIRPLQRIMGKMSRLLAPIL